MWNTSALWWGLSYACKDNQLPQHPPIFPLQFSSISLQTTYTFLVNMETKNWDPHFCGMCNSRLAFHKGQVTIHFGTFLSLGQIKHVVTWWCSTSFQLTNNSAWIGAMEIARFIEDVHMPGDHIHQTRHPLISTCMDTWRSWCINRNCTHSMNSQRAWWQWCSCMKQPQTHM